MHSRWTLRKCQHFETTPLILRLQVQRTCSTKNRKSTKFEKHHSPLTLLSEVLKAQLPRSAGYAVRPVDAAQREAGAPHAQQHAAEDREQREAHGRRGAHLPRQTARIETRPSAGMLGRPCSWALATCPPRVDSFDGQRDGFPRQQKPRDVSIILAQNTL